MIRFFVAGKPKTKGSPSILRGRGGRPFVRESDDERAWEEAIRAEAYSAVAREGWVHPHAVCVRLAFVCQAPVNPRAKSQSPASKPHGDIDKLSRACLDAMQGVLYRDDFQVTKLEAVKMVSAATPAGVWIEVSAA